MFDMTLYLQYQHQSITSHDSVGYNFNIHWLAMCVFFGLLHFLFTGQKPETFVNKSKQTGCSYGTVL